MMIMMNIEMEKVNCYNITTDWLKIKHRSIGYSKVNKVYFTQKEKINEMTIDYDQTELDSCS